MKTAIFVLRGMLGASIGGIVWMFPARSLHGSSERPKRFGITYLLVFGACPLDARRPGGNNCLRNLGYSLVNGRGASGVYRMSIATAVALIPMALLLFRTEEPLTLFNLWYPIFFGNTVGGLAGLFVGSPKRLAGDRTAVEQIVGRLEQTMEVISCVSHSKEKRPMATLHGDEIGACPNCGERIGDQASGNLV